MYSFTFYYDQRGYGYLCLYYKDSKVAEYSARTGSITDAGDAVKLLPPRDYWIKDEPVDTTEDNMHFTTPDKGWKVRLYDPNFTHYLIHPIKHGTLGCIGLIGTDALPLKQRIHEILQQQAEIKVEVKRV